METEESLAAQFKGYHNQLDEIFLLHQEALLQGHLRKAGGLLSCYASCHELHMQFEDDVLLPKYSSLAERGKWDATLYRHEHQKLEDLYHMIEQFLLCLMEQDLDASQLRRNIIQLLDREKSFKGLREHHQEREEISLLVELDRQTDASWRAQVRDTFSAEWKRKFEQELKTIEALQKNRS